MVEPALEGTWVPADANANANDDAELQIQKSGDHQYTLTVTEASEHSVQTYDINLVRLGSHLFADMIFDSETVAGQKVESPVGEVPMHVILRVEVTADQLSYAALDDDAVQKQNAQEATPLKLVSVGSTLLIVDDTEALRTYVSVHALDRFSDPEKLKRKGK